MDIAPDHSPRLREWLQKAAVGIAVTPVTRYGPDPHGPRDWWAVEVNNGQGGHAGAGAEIAYCHTEGDAELIATALWSLVTDVRSGEK